MVPSNVLPWPDVRDQLDSMLRGWQAYFDYGTLSEVYSKANWYVANRVRHFLRRRAEARFATSCGGALRCDRDVALSGWWESSP